VVCDFFGLGDGDEVAEAPDGQYNSQESEWRRWSVERPNVRLEGMLVMAHTKEIGCNAQGP
jgi:hypothetical protein